MWIVCEGESLPIKKNGRLGRMGLLAEYMSNQGHDVVWWTSTFDHGEKTYLFDHTKKLQLNQREELILIHSPIAYKRNVSISRIIYHIILAKRFGKMNHMESTPDIILCSWATQQFASECIKYGKKRHVPVVIDIRDPWPDYFLRVFPKWARSIGRILIYPLHKDAEKTLREADAITGVIPSEVEWGLSLAGRKATPLDRHVFIGNTKIDRNTPNNDETLEWWSKRGILSQTWNLCLVGTLSDQGDYDTLIMAAKRVAKKYKNFRLIMAGDGDERNRLEKLAHGWPQIVFPGWIDMEKIRTLLRISKCGAFSYKNSNGFRDSVGNKVVQYFSSGLPVITTLEGISRKMITEYGAGLYYPEGNIDECERAIESLMGDEQKRKLMGERSHALFSEVFDQTIINRQFVELLEDVINTYRREVS